MRLLAETRFGDGSLHTVPSSPQCTDHVISTLLSGDVSMQTPSHYTFTSLRSHEIAKIFFVIFESFSDIHVSISSFLLQYSGFSHTGQNPDKDPGSVLQCVYPDMKSV